MSRPTGSGRVTGMFARFFLGDASGGTNYYASADLRKWGLRAQTRDVDLSACDDVDDVGAPTTRSCTFTAEKMLVTADFAKEYAERGFAYATFYRGGQASAGAEVASGVVYLTDFSIDAARGEAMIENVSGKFTGAVTFANA